MGTIQSLHRDSQASLGLWPMDAATSELALVVILSRANRFRHNFLTGICLSAA